MTSNLDPHRETPVCADIGSPPRLLTLEPGQLAKLARAVAVAVTESLAHQHAIGRSSYSLAEVAQRAGLSEGYIREDVRRGLLRVVRPGDRDVARVLPGDEGLWLQGRAQASDRPAEGLSPRVVRRNTVRSVLAGVLRKSRQEHRL